MDSNEVSRNIESLAAVWNALAQVTNNLNAEQWSRPTECPGWDIADQLIHIIGIERQIEGEPAPEHDVSSISFVHNPIGEMNQQWIAALKPLGPEAIHDLFVEQTRRRLSHLQSLSPEQLETEVWTPMGQQPISEMLKLRLFDSYIHLLDVTRALEVIAPRELQAEQVALGFLLRAIPGILARQKIVSSGDPYTVSVLGENENTWCWEDQGGRVVLSEGFSNAGITVPAESLLLRFCGRIRSEQVLSEPETTVRGDPQKAHQLLGSLNVVP